MYSIYKVPYYQVIMLLLLVNFLPHIIHSSLTYEILKLLLPLLNLALTKTWHQGTKHSLLLLMRLFILFSHCLHYNNTSQRLYKENQILFSSHSTPKWSATLVPLAIDFSLVFLVMINGFREKDNFTPRSKLYGFNYKIDDNFTIRIHNKLWVHVQWITRLF